MSKIQLTGKDVITLLNNSKQIGTMEAGINLAIEYIEHADKEINRLVDKLKTYGVHFSDCNSLTSSGPCTCGYIEAIKHG